MIPDMFPTAELRIALPVPIRPRYTQFASPSLFSDARSQRLLVDFSRLNNRFLFSNSQFYFLLREITVTTWSHASDLDCFVFRNRRSIPRRELRNRLGQQVLVDLPSHFFRRYQPGLGFLYFCVLLAHFEKSDADNLNSDLPAIAGPMFG